MSRVGIANSSVIGWSVFFHSVANIFSPTDIIRYLSYVDILGFWSVTGTVRVRLVYSEVSIDSFRVYPAMNTSGSTLLH